LIEWPLISGAYLGFKDGEGMSISVHKAHGEDFKVY